MLLLRTLGRLTLEDEGRIEDIQAPRRQLLAIMATLATIRSHRAPRRWIAELFFGASAAKPRDSLRKALHELRRSSAGPALLEDGTHIALNPRRVDVDLWRFDRAIADARYEDAIALYEGPFLIDVAAGNRFELRGVIAAQDAALSASLQVAFHSVISAALPDDPAEALRRADQLAVFEPMSEGPVRLRVEALRHAGRPLEAVRTFDAYKALLAVEEDEPSLEFTAVVEALRRLPDLPPPNHEYGTQARARDQASPPARRGPRLLPLGWGLIGGALGLVLALAGTRGVDDGDLGLRGLEIVAPAVIITDEGPVSALFTLQKGRTGWTPVRWAEVRSSWRLQPGGDGIAVSELRRGGIDVTHRTEDGIGALVLKHATDEEPLGWSPDGAWISYRRRPVLDVPGELWMPGVARVDADERREFPHLSTGRRLDMAWSQDGTRIAVTNDSSRIVLIDPTGHPLESLALQPGDLASRPAWAPDSEVLAFTLSRDRRYGVFVWDPRAGEPLQVTVPPSTGFDAGWVDDERLMYTSRTDSGAVVWIHNVQSGRRRAIYSGTELSALRASDLMRAGSRWIDSLHVQVPDSVVSEGAFLDLAVTSLTTFGEPHRLDTSRLVWTSSDTTVVRIVAAGRSRVVGYGEAEIGASLPGWRTARARITSRPMGRLEMQPAFVEDWSHGISTDVWTPYGDPLPGTRSDAFSSRTVFISNGDSTYQSGVVSRASFALGGGLTLAVEGRAPFDGDHFEDLRLGFALSLPDSTTLDVAHEPRNPSVLLNGADGRLVANGVDVAGRWQVVLPMVPTPGDWHLYALQIGPDGRLSLVVDGQLFWVSDRVAALLGTTRLHAWIGGNSVGADILHGELRVIEGLLFQVLGRPGAEAR